jgi:hypothetical protein
MKLIIGVLTELDSRRSPSCKKPQTRVAALTVLGVGTQVERGSNQL